jgi:hypothetical protein
MIYDAERMGTMPCRCGRPSNKIHCPYCGSFDTRARAQLKTSKLDPATETLKEYQVHRCRKCGKLFDEHEVKFECKAPIPVIKSAGIGLTKGLDRRGVDAATGLIKGGKLFNNEELNDLVKLAQQSKEANKGKPRPRPDFSQMTEIEVYEWKRNFAPEELEK